MSRNWIARTLVAIVLSACLLSLFLIFGNSEMIASAIQHVESLDVLQWFLVYAALLIARAIRFQNVYPEAELITVLRAMTAQGGVNRVMPFRLGELSLPYLIQQRQQLPTVPLLLALGWVRLLEVSLVVIGMMIGLLYLGWGSDDIAGQSVFGIAVLSALIFVFVDPTQLTLPLARRMAHLTPKLTQRYPKFGHVWASISASISGLPHLDRLARLKFMLTSVSVYILTLCVYAVILQTLGFSVGIGALLVGVGAAQLSSVLPILTIGSIGLHETGWVGGFVFAGMHLDAAITTGVLTQAITLCLAIFYGLGAYFLIAKRAVAAAD